MDERGGEIMKLVYATDPYPTLKIVDGNLNWVIKSIGVSGLDAANKITDMVAFGKITIDDLLDTSIATGSDALKLGGKS
jgi:hypothetical protein